MISVYTLFNIVLIGTFIYIGSVILYAMYRMFRDFNEIFRRRF